MSEKEILKKIDDWDDMDNIQAIVDFVENLPIEKRTTPVLSELGRAYNNLYWLDQTADNSHYLRKAIDVFKYLEDELSEDASWNYRIGYSYFYLGEGELAKKYFLKERALDGCGNDVETYLDCIDFASKKGISCVEVYNGGRAKIQYPLEFLFNLLEEKAPNMKKLLAKGVSQTEIDQFEKQIGVKLPESFKELHQKFSGQTQDVPFFDSDNQKFVSLNDIPKVQKRWLDFVKQHYGTNWQEKHLSEDNVEETVKNALFNEKWIPLLAGEQTFICMDLDPEIDVFRKEEDVYGQIIFVSIGEEIDDCTISFLFDDISEWIGYINRNLRSEGLIYNEEEKVLMFANNNNYGPFYYDEEERTALESYIEKTFGKIDEVFHEIDSPDIHCDIYVIKPTPERNYYTLVTGGMGAFQMYTPEDYPSSPFAELAINLPPTWNIKSEDEKDYWPIRWLKNLARLPINHQTYLGYGHTIPVSYDGEPLEGTNFDCLLLVGVTTDEKDEEGNHLWACTELPSEKVVAFYQVVPLYPEETNFKLDNSADELLDKFEQADIPYPPVVDLNRVNVCEGYQSVDTPTLLDDVAWAFKGQFYGSLMSFWQDVQDYNNDIENELEDFAPFATIFNTRKVKVIYEAYIQSTKDLLEDETLLNPDTFNDPEPDGLFFARILAELTSDDRDYFGALNLLRHINNNLSNKELGDHIFFEGFDVEAYEEDGTPVIFLNLGS